jgi:hypothetical protein
MQEQFGLQSHRRYVPAGIAGVQGAFVGNKQVYLLRLSDFRKLPKVPPLALQHIPLLSKSIHILNFCL